MKARKSMWKQSMRAHPAALVLTIALLTTKAAHAQGTPRGYWPVVGADAAHNGWQKAETQISPESITTTFKFLWKLKLGTGDRKSPSFTEPLLVPGLITGKGFKDLALLGDAHTLYAVDSELGALVWQKDFALQPAAHPACAGANLQVVTEPPQVIHFGAHKPVAAHPAVPAPPPSEAGVPPSERRVGASPGGGYFGLRGVYILTSDGYLHEQIMATGLDFAPPVKFIAQPGGSSFGLNMNDKIIYAAAGPGCHNVASAVWSIDLNNQAYTVSSYKAQRLSVSGLAGMAIGRDGVGYLAIGSGPADPATGVYPDSVVALDAEGLKVKDWYAPTAASEKIWNAGPVIFPYKDKELIAAAGGDGTLLLLDSSSLGGADHHTVLAKTEKIFAATKREQWNSLAAWQDKSGSTWVFVSYAGPLADPAKFAANQGPAPHGSIAAFKVEEKEGHPVLTPAWVSRDLISPAPPVVANGIVFALDGGKPSAHATLYALDAATGKQLFTSGDTVQSYARLSAMSVGDGHVFFTTHDNTLYSFGIPLEH